MQSTNGWHFSEIDIVNQLEIVMYGKYREELIRELEEINESGLYKSEQYITSAQQARIHVAEKQVLNLCSRWKHI